MEWLNYHHLRYFWTVAKEGSLARAAKKLHVSQPSISEQIRELESAFGEKLFQREGRNNKLTAAGRVVFKAAHRQPDTRVYWYLDEEYLGETRDIHEMALSPRPGPHRLTLVDEHGETVTRRFDVLSRDDAGDRRAASGP